MTSHHHQPPSTNMTKPGRDKVTQSFSVKYYVNVRCGGACSPRLPEVSPHYRVVVKAFASGHCGPGSIQVGADAYSPPKW